MWFRQHGYRIIIAVLSPWLLGLFGCAEERGPDASLMASSEAYRQPVTEPQEIKISVRLKGNAHEAASSVNEAPKDVMATDATTLPNGQSDILPVAVEGGAFAAPGPYGTLGAPFAPPFGGPSLVGGPLYGPGVPFSVEDVPADDDDHERRDHRKKKDKCHNRRDEERDVR